jgi:acetyl esterase/lipase
MVKMSDGTGILVAEFRPDDTPRPSKAIYHIHGGAMISGSVDLFDKRLKSVAAGFGVPVFAVDYRLAPEHPHPIPVTDCFTGLRWLSENSKDLGVDSTKIIVHGESAGGGLAGKFSVASLQPCTS